MGNSIQRGADGQNGVHCWEANFIDSDGDGLPNPEFDSDSDGIADGDINRDGTLTSADCLGARGIQGPQGLRGNDGQNGTNGTNGRDGTNGTNGVNCFDGLTIDFNGDGVIKCRVGGEIPGGIDSTGLMNEHIQNANGTPITATAQCSPGKRLIMSTVTSVKTRQQHC